MASRVDSKPSPPPPPPKPKLQPKLAQAVKPGDLAARAGDTLEKIAQGQGLTVDELARANPQLKGRSLRTGEVVHLPLDRYETAGAASGGARPTAAIDPRLVARGDLVISPKIDGAAGTFDVAAVAFQDDDKSGGKHNVYVRVADGAGKEIPPDQMAKYFDVHWVAGDGQPDLLANPKIKDAYGVPRDAWVNGENSGGATLAYFDIPMAKGMAMKVWVTPKNVPDNPYAGYGSQQVGPFYMPGNHHVDYFVTFQAAGGGSQPVTPPITPPVDPPKPQPTDPSAIRIADYAKGKDLGKPSGDAVTLAGFGVMQRYSGGAATEGECAVVDGQSGAHLVKNSFYRSYQQGDTASRLGAPKGEEGWENGVYTQRFEHGKMVWANDQVSVQFDSSASPTTSAQPTTPAAPPPAGSKLDQLLAVSPEIKTNQDLINYFYRVGGNTWTGACASAAQFGVDLNALAANRSAKIASAAPTTPVAPAPTADLGQMVEGVYQQVLGRPSDPGGKANWVSFAQGMRAKGASDKDIQDALTVKFKQSDEYLRKSPTSPTNPTSPTVPVDPTKPGPAGAAGSVYAPLDIAPGATINGRLGFDWRSDCYDSDMNRAQAIIDRAKALGVGYCTLLVDPARPEANAALIAKLQQNGITPVVRMYVGAAPDTWSDQDIAQMASCAQKLAGMGVKLIQVGNEPNLEGHLKERGMLNPDAWKKYLDASCARQAQALLAVKKAVGNFAEIGLPPVAGGSPDKVDWGSYSAETYFPTLLKAIKSVEQTSGMHIVDWIPTHTYDMDTPGTSPGADTARGHLGFGPTTSTWFEDQAAQILGRRMHSLSTEGGAEPNAFRNDPARTKALMQESMDQLQSNKNLTNCLWLLYDDAGMSKGEWGKWDKMALWDGEKNWGGGLDLYRTDYTKARTGG